MKNLFLILSALIIISFTGCDSKTTTSGNESEESPKFPMEIKRVLDAHGGYEKWSSMRALTYALENGEEHKISLWDRKTLISSVDKTIGFDGTNVWVSPDTIPVGSARFYYSVYFYFYAMPFVLGDPGIKYESVGSKELLGENYNGIKVSYEDGVGDAPKDNYILWYNTETFQMEWLMYTVTYGRDAVSDDYRLIRYPAWNDFSGLKLPTRLDWYVYQNDSVGEVRNTKEFSEISISNVPFDTTQFVMPINAQIAPLN